MKALACVVSLGCSKNLVDSEVMIPQLLNLGYEMSSDPSEASLILVNTCGFLKTAVQEALDTILDLARHKESGHCRVLIVTGCMVQRYGKKLLNLLPEVDLFLGTSHYHRLEESLDAHLHGDPGRLFIERPRDIPSGDIPRLRSTGFYSAYLKIADGCSNRCTFCLIPRLRGPYRSRTREDIVEEARKLAEDGVKEINLIAQDTTAFGLDRGEGHGLVHLLESLDRVDGIEWVRLLYAYPDRVDDLLLRTMAGSSKVTPYLDVPLQHSVPRILKAMRGGDCLTDLDGFIERVRSIVPDVFLRTSLIVGFPGETERDFEDLCRFVERAGFAHAGVFEFSPEEGTRAARLPSQVDEDVKVERRHVLLELQRDISRKRLERLVGRTVPVLVEGTHPETELLLAGRLAGQAPEVDGSVIIVEGMGETGRIMPAKITASHDYDVEAELVYSHDDTCKTSLTGSNPPL
jgi:ribosomal protein S12 methylthiotransferase